jgi:hypothetical protein
MLIYTPLPFYESSTVLSSPLLLFRKHNIIVSLLAVASPSIDAPEPRRLVAGVSCCVEERDSPRDSRPCLRCATIGERGKGSGG